MSHAHLFAFMYCSAAAWRRQRLAIRGHRLRHSLAPCQAARRAINVEKSIPTMLAELEQHGVVDNFLRLEGKKDTPRRGPLYTDSDIYKWMEAVAFVLQSGEQPKLHAEFDRLTGIILAAQEPSGYLNTYWSEERTPKRFTEMYRSHELYCMGHLLQAAIAYYRATGDRKLLDGGIRFANYMVE